MLDDDNSVGLGHAVGVNCSDDDDDDDDDDGDDESRKSSR